MDAPNKRRLFLRMLGISGALGFLALLAARLLLTSRLDSALGADAGHLLHQWENLAYTAAFVSAAVLLFTHPGLPLPSQAAQQRRKMHADVLRLPNAGIHVPVLRVGAGTGAGHGTVGLPVRPPLPSSCFKPGRAASG